MRELGRKWFGFPEQIGDKLLIDLACTIGEFQTAQLSVSQNIPNQPKHTSRVVDVKTFTTTIQSNP